MKQLLGVRPRSILVISYGGHGDILLTTPLLSSLKGAFPTARIDVFLQAGRGGMLEGNPDIDGVSVTRRRHGIGSYLDFVRRFALRYDLAVSVRASDRQTLFARVAGRRAIGLVPRGGPGSRWMRALLSGWASRDGSHCANEILSLADVLGIARTTRCRIPSDAGSAARLDELLPFDWRNEPFALLHLYPRNPYKQWSLDGWCAVIQTLLCRGLRVVVAGSADRDELAYVDALAARCAPGALAVVAGRTSLADAAVLLRACRLYVGLDTALTHLAAAVEAPVVALYGPPIGHHYFPYHAGLLAECIRTIAPGLEASGSVRVVRGVCDCAASPTRCERAPAVESDCMRAIAPARVVALVEEIVNREP